jgi:hypothetical protein
MSESVEGELAMHLMGHNDHEYGGSMTRDNCVLVLT